MNDDVKSLKEKLKKKSIKLKNLNKKIVFLKNKLDDIHQKKYIYQKKYETIKRLLPLKYYRITYEVIDYNSFPPPVKEFKKLLCGVHPKEVILDLSLNLPEHKHVNLIDILEVAS